VEMMAQLSISLDNAYCAVCERSEEKENSGHYSMAIMDRAEQT
jgi:hypothetical protein